MTDKPFDPNKPVRTRDGREVIIDKVLSPNEALYGGYRIIGRVLCPSGWHVQTWVIDGRVLANSHDPENADLVNIPARHRRWVNFYGHDGVRCTVEHSTKESADLHAAGRRIACKLVEFDEGEGL